MGENPAWEKSTRSSHPSLVCCNALICLHAMMGLALDDGACARTRRGVCQRCRKSGCTSTCFRPINCRRVYKAKRRPLSLTVDPCPVGIPRVRAGPLSLRPCPAITITTVTCWAPTPRLPDSRPTCHLFLRRYRPRPQLQLPSVARRLRAPRAGAVRGEREAEGPVYRGS